MNEALLLRLEGASALSQAMEALQAGATLDTGQDNSKQEAPQEVEEKQVEEEDKDSTLEGWLGISAVYGWAGLKQT